MFPSIYSLLSYGPKIINRKKRSTEIIYATRQIHYDLSHKDVSKTLTRPRKQHQDQLHQEHKTKRCFKKTEEEKKSVDLVKSATLHLPTITPTENTCLSYIQS